jgi:hypothetical protein
MNLSPRLVRTKKRVFSAHHMLLNAANLHLEAARSSELSRFNNTLAAMTLAALSIEALANSIGDRVVPDWRDFEALSPQGKIRLLSERLAVEFDKQQEPWATIHWLGVFRNRIAHAKPEEITDVESVTQEQVDREMFAVPHSKLERDITLGNAIRAVEAVYELKSCLCAKLTIEQAFGIEVDMWSVGTEA